MSVLYLLQHALTSSSTTPHLNFTLLSVDSLPLHAPSMQLLIEHGSDVFDTNADGDTACDLAVKNSHFDVAEFLEVKMVFAVSRTEDKNQPKLGVHLISLLVKFYPHIGSSHTCQQWC